MLTIDRTSPQPCYLQVYEQLANGIDNGLYPAGKKLPSIRECARELGVSNTTIELAYQRLVDEGYVRAKRGSGYTICDAVEIPDHPRHSFNLEYQKELAQLVKDERLRNQASATEFDFRYDAVDATIFPFASWARICREVFLRRGAEEACQYNDRQGLYELREQIAHYLSSECAVDCVAEQVLVMPTTRDLIGAILAVLPPDTHIVMEDPGYDEVRRRLLHAGFTVTSIPVRPFPTWEEALPAIEGADLVFTTPASQFPSNTMMPIELREQLVAWAKETGAYLIDDEYCWEFQNATPRPPALASLDTDGRVILLGTFSNTFTPAVALSYAVLPPALMRAWRAKEGSSHPQVPWQTQAAMATFMRNDLWRTHIRRSRTSVALKRQTLMAAIREYMGDAVDVIEGQSSMFALVKTKDSRTEDELIAAAAKRGVRVYPTNRYWDSEPPNDWRYVQIGFAGIPHFKIEAGIQELAKAWGFEV